MELKLTGSSVVVELGSQLVEQGEEAQNIATFDIKKDKGGRQEDQEKSVLTYEKCTVLIIYLKSEVDFERL